MTKRATAFLLALLMVAQVLVPGAARAEKAVLPYPKMDKELVEVGKVDGKDYPKLTNKVILDIQKQATENSRKYLQKKSGATAFNTPYLPGQDIPDKDKPRIVGKVSADFKTIGLDGGEFDWEGVFGKDSNGNLGKAKLVFKQWLNNKETGRFYELEVSRDGKYSWTDWTGEPARIPLYSEGLEAYTYSAYLDQDVSEKVKLLTYRIAGTPGSAGFEKDPETGLNVANIVIDLSIQQVASTKFVSEWHTGLAENARPPVNGEFDNKIDEYPGYFPFSTKDGGSIIIRNDFVNNSDYEDPGYTEYSSSSLVKTPVVKVTEGIEFADENDEVGSPTYNIDEANKTITTLDGAHKFKYDFTYDVINGGKLTMTEILPVTFDANGGKFKNFTAPDTDKKIVKEVDYEKDVTAPKAPTKEGETFIGWGDKTDAKTPVSADAFKGIKEAKTFYAIFTKDIIEQDGEDKPNDVPDGHVKVTVDVTDKAKLGEGEKQTRIFWVDPKKEVTLPVTKPTGKDVPVSDTNSKAYTWEFTKWTSDEAAQRAWGDGITATFPKETTITANYDKSITDQGKVVADEIVAYESVKGVNDFIPSEDDLKAAVKVNDANGNEVNLPEGAEVELVDDSGAAYADDALKNALYDKLQEKDNPNDEPTRVEKVKAKVTFKNGEVQTVDIPIKVFKNIYEAKTLTEKPFYVPDGYVKVTLDPTTKAQEPQKTYYYVNKDAQVVIPGKDPVGTGDNQFTKWLIKGTETEYKLADKPRHQFEAETTIEAQYVSDVIPQDGDTKPEGVPDNFVKVTFVPTDKGTMEGAKIFWVNPKKEVTIPVKNPVGKQYFTFNEWKIGDVTSGETYTVGTAKKFGTATTITATYDEAKNIISYDPSVPDPMVRPEGYVRVTFAAEPGLKLTDQKAYYVKKNAKITLKAIKNDTTNYGYPGVTANTGYKFKEWDKADTFEIEEADIVVTAKATKLGNVIPEKDKNGNDNEKPEGYKEVNFVIKTEDKDKGSITGVNKFYVNPTEYVTINPPTTEAKTGYKFGAWDQDAKIPTVYDKDTTITGFFNELDDVIPNKNPDGTKNEKPDNYVTVTFVLEKFKDNEVGRFNDKDITVYYVNPEKEVYLLTPTPIADTGYKFNFWSPPVVKKKYTKDTTIKGYFKKLDDIIPGDQSKPDGYVTAIFVKGQHGTLSGQTVYYVNPNAGITRGKLNAPAVEPEIGYVFDKWSIAEDAPINADRSTYSIEAYYNEIPDVVPKTTDDESDKPEGYITVTFEKGDHGMLEGTTVYYVNPDKAVVLKDKAPKIKPDTGYKSAGWDTTIEKAIQYKDGDKITALYNEPGNISETEVVGYVKVVFNEGASGTLEGTQVYWIKPDVEVNIPAPTVKPYVGYKFDKWDKPLTVTAKANDPTYEITAQYEALDDIIPQKNTDGSDKPEGYVTVTFKAVNGSLEGTTTYYVNGEKEVDLTNTANAITKKANVGFTDDGGTWSPTITSKKYTADETYTFNFVKRADVIPEKKDDGSTNTKPDGYVTVTLIPTNKATDATNKVYFVNPTVEVTIEDTPVGTEFTDTNGITYKYTFTGWTVTRGNVNSWSNGTIKDKFIQDTDITAKYSTKVDIGTLIPAPVPKKDVVTPINDVPKPKDLIKNIPGSTNDPLPDGTKITYTDDGTPDVKNPGDTTAKVKIEYPGGKTVVVEVPITVVDNVVPQIGGEDGEKPLVPDSYVKVTVDTTDKATANTKFTKVFWVKPNVEVTIPNILAPTGKEETIDGVKKINKFVEWKLEGSDPAKTYKKGITDTFTAKENTIVATYEYDKNVEPVGKNNPWIPQGSNPSPKDFIENPYDDNDPNNKDNLPPGTRFEFVPGTEPNTSEPGEGKKTTIKVIYPNGETKEVPVTFRVTGDVVEQKDPNNKPNVPDNFVIVIVKTTDLATVDTAFEKTFWVNPDKYVKISVSSPEGRQINRPNGKLDYKWKFIYWDKSLVGMFTEDETVITAQYVKEYGKPDPEIIEKPVPGDCNNSCDQPNKPNQPNIGMDALNTTDHYQYLIGYPDGNFAPNRGMTRAEVATMFTRLLKERPVKGQRYYTGFSDIQDGDWYANTVGYAVQVGIVSGYPDGSFKPNKPITRAEFASIASRFDALAQGNDIAFNDLAPSHWGYNAIRSAATKGWISGYPDNTFRPEKAISRAEVTSITNRMLNRYADLYWIDAHRGEVIRFGDVKRGDWYFEPIMEATMGHDFIRDRDGKTEHWTGLNGKSFI